MNIKKVKKQLCLFCSVLMLGSNMTAFATEDNPTISEDGDLSSEVTYKGTTTFKVIIPKTIVLGVNGTSASAKYSITVSGDISSDEMIYVAPIDGIAKDADTNNNDDIDFYLKDQSTVAQKDDIVAKINQTKNYWKYSDISGDGSTISDNEITASNVSAGSWSGTFSFTISLHSHTWEESDIVDATCTTTGSKTLTCNICGDVEENVEIATTNHNFVDGNVYCTNGCGTVNSNIIVDTLNGYTWSEVKAICEEGNAKEYFSVGDTAIISLGSVNTMTYSYYGTLGTITSIDDQKATLVVADVADDSVTMLFTSYSTQAPAYQMNPQTSTYTYGTNIGGWEATILRTWLNNTSEGGFYNALPNDLKSVIKENDTTYSETYNASDVLTCKDYLWLLSAKEVFGGDIATSASSNTTYYENLAAFNVETQLAYFANITSGDSKIVRYQTGTSGTKVYWWLRSSRSTGGDHFCNVGTSGVAGATGARYAYGVFPAFRIG